MTMSSPNSKRQRKSCTNGDLDIISELPLELKQQILTNLPIQESVRTSVLSSRWRHAWISVSRLVLDRQSLFKEESDTASQQFIQIVDKVLSQHKAVPISIFYLSVTEFCKEALHRWINELSKHPVEIFCIKSLAGPQYDVSSELYMFPKLKEVRLTNCTISLPDNFSEFKQLKSLSMKCCTLKEDVLEKLISSCLNLEILDLYSLSSMISVNINSQKLKKIRLIGDFKKLHLKTPFLIEACIVSSRGKIELDRVDRCDRLDHLFRIPKLLFKIIEKPEKPLPKILNNLKSLCIVVDFGDENKSALALSLLKNAASLQILLLCVEGNVKPESNDVMIKFWESVEFSFDHLKFVMVSNTAKERSLCSKPVLAFMKVLLERAAQLENVSCLSTKDPFEELQFAYKLHTFKKASGKCVLTVKQLALIKKMSHNVRLSNRPR